MKRPMKRLRMRVNVDQKRHIVLRENVLLNLFHAVRQLSEGLPLQSLIYWNKNSNWDIPSQLSLNEMAVFHPVSSPILAANLREWR